eukprot:10888641-Ditylum_brightwellii.AAC.2
MGYQQNFPKAVVYGLKYAGGISFTHLQAYQLGAKVVGARRHVQANTKLGGNFITIVHWAQMCASTGVTVLEQGTEIPHLDGKWLRSMLHDLHAIRRKIHLVNVWVVPAMRESDKHLKDIFYASRHIQRHHYFHLNYCHIYHKVTCLLYIATSDGQHVKDNSLNCTLPQRLKCQHNLNWPHQSCPDEWVWNLWRNTLAETMCSNNRKLHKTLGKWTEDNDQ